MDTLHKLFSEDVGLAVVLFSWALGAGLTVATSSPRDVRLAHWFFVLGFVWSGGCTMEWLIHSEADVKSYVLAFLIGGSIFAMWLASARWVEANYNKQLNAGDMKPSTDQSTPEPASNPAQKQNNSGGTNIQQSNSAPNSTNTNVVGNGNRVTVYSSPQKKSGFEESEPDNISVSLGGMTSNYAVKMIKQRPQEPFYIGGFSPVRLHFTNHVLYCDVKMWGGPD
jgi:hypothetical protein